MCHEVSFVIRYSLYLCLVIANKIPDKYSSMREVKQSRQPCGIDDVSCRPSCLSKASLSCMYECRPFCSVWPLNNMTSLPSKEFKEVVVRSATDLVVSQVLLKCEVHDDVPDGKEEGQEIEPD